MRASRINMHRATVDDGDNNLFIGNRIGEIRESMDRSSLDWINFNLVFAFGSVIF